MEGTTFLKESKPNLEEGAYLGPCFSRKRSKGESLVNKKDLRVEIAETWIKLLSR